MKTEIRKRDLKDKTKQETPNKQKKLMKRNLSHVIFDVVVFMKQKQRNKPRKNNKKKEGLKKNRTTRKEKQQKTRERDIERESAKEK